MKMRKFINIFLSIFLICTIVLMCNSAFAAKEPHDEIQDYVISVDVLGDGTAKIVYHFEWKVLDSDSDGPLEYLFVEIPNKHIDNVIALSDNIRSIKYTSSSDNGSGNFLRIDFNRKYYKDEIFTFDFSIEQGHMYILKDNGTIEFGFTPGWFPNIAIKNLTVKWNGSYVKESNSQYKDENDQLIWTTILEAGQDEKMSVILVYDQSQFESLGKYKQSTNTKGGLSAGAILVIILIVIFIVLILFVIMDDGYGGGGYYGGGGVGYHGDRVLGST